MEMRIAGSGASYWEWSASKVEPSDVFSADHIEANLVKAASTVEPKSVNNFL
jgi:hypothetical protein